MYNPFWNKTITLFTPLISSEHEITWYKYILNNTFVKCNNNKNYNNQGYNTTNNTIVRIDTFGYEDYNSWINLSEEDKIKRFSISQESIIVLQSIEETLNANESGTYLFDKYECTKPIKIINNSYQFLPHILITGD